MIQPQQVLGPLRILLPVLTTGLVSSGWLTAGQAEPFTQQVLEAANAILTLGMIAWSVIEWAKHRQIKRVADMPEVATVVTDAKTANSAPLAKVSNIVSQ